VVEVRILRALVDCSTFSAIVSSFLDGVKMEYHTPAPLTTALAAAPALLLGLVPAQDIVSLVLI
jgi:hypothetical protein